MGSFMLSEMENKGKMFPNQTLIKSCNYFLPLSCSMWDSVFAGMKRGLCPDTQNKNEDHFVDVRDYRGSGAFGCFSPGHPLQCRLHFCFNFLFQFASNLSSFFLLSLSAPAHKGVYLLCMTAR